MPRLLLEAHREDPMEEALQASEDSWGFTLKDLPGSAVDSRLLRTALVT